MNRQAFSAPGSTAVGPYSHGVRARGDVVFLSGQTPLDGATGKLVVGDIKDQVRQCLKQPGDCSGIGSPDL
ncbi:RidA family protein [Mesorhizobium caraganae]|uniref:RidA family protein n=1 Tax=Mesorhizobium caraganae TaxID=483206 RepID=UPI001FF00163|nr:Rid family hydrolase [Mesorhizobium caraganae]